MKFIFSSLVYFHNIMLFKGINWDSSFLAMLDRMLGAWKIPVFVFHVFMNYYDDGI